MSTIATITVRVSSFAPIGSGFCSTVPLQPSDISDPSGRVTVKGANGIAVSNPGQPGHRPGEIILKFTVVPAAGTSGSYKICGLIMKNSGLSNGANPGNVDFTLQSLDNNNMELANRYKHGKKANGSGTSFKLYIAVTNDPAEQSVGIIDPDIENNDEL